MLVRPGGGRINVLMMLQQQQQDPSDVKHTRYQRGSTLCSCFYVPFLAVLETRLQAQGFLHSQLLLSLAFFFFFFYVRSHLPSSMKRLDKAVYLVREMKRCAARQRERPPAPPNTCPISPRALNVFHQCCWCSGALSSLGNRVIGFCLFLALSVYYFHG